MNRILMICGSQYAIFLAISVAFYYGRIVNGVPEAEAAKAFTTAMIALTCVTVINAIVLITVNHFRK